MSVDVLNESGVDEVDITRLTSLVRYVLRQMRLHPQTEVTLRLVDADTIAVLNERWMGKHGPTDVLSFPMDELTPGSQDDDEDAGYLGDIALCPQIAQDQAPAGGHSAAEEIELLTVHGLLHLMGYDHAEPAEHAEMFAIQGKLLLQWRESL